MTYFEFTKRFPDETSAINFIVSVKYKNGYVCPKCGCVHKIYHQHYDPRKLYCNNCKTEWSALVGTIFENTHLDLRMWLYAINLCMIARKGISALQLQRELGMGCYQSAWRMLHLIRKAMGKEMYKDTFEAIVEIDETYVGGNREKRINIQRMMITHETNAVVEQVNPCCLCGRMWKWKNICKGGITKQGREDIEWKAVVENP